MASFDDDDVARAIALLEAIEQDRSVLASFPEERRRALLIAAGKISRPGRDDQRKLVKAFRRKQRADVQARDRELRFDTGIRSARRAEVFVAPARLLDAASVATEPGPSEPDTTSEPVRELERPRNCYVCKEPYRSLHFFYDSLCPPCAKLNYEKRFQTASLQGRVALITGARLKIGYQAALMMLRAGAEVVVTTRFPRDAAARYARESDFGAWRDRLEVHGLDLRHAPSVEIFTRYLTLTKSRLDILINNAAQTVRRPPGFYAHMLENEALPFDGLSRDVQALLASHERCKRSLDALPAELPRATANGGQSNLAVATGEASGFVAWRQTGGASLPGAGIRESAQLSQIPCAYDDASQDALVFPAAKVDADLQQVDLRTTNSWRLTLGDVPAAEMLEVQLVNAVAPFILCSKLKPLMLRHRTDEKHIVNVSAMEGQFARGTKTDKHPHTNMAKAALNMMTFTSAQDYAKDGIFMNAVDTGWVTDEDPAQHSQRKREHHDFEPPLDVVDGAARICDPFFSGLLSGKHVWGKFLKDYAPAPW